MRRFELRIETGGPLSIIELNEIIEIIDDHITQAFDHYDRYFPPYRRRRNLADGVDFSFVGIESARTGSIIGPVDKRDSRTVRSVIQDCFLGGGLGSRSDVGRGMGVFQAVRNGGNGAPA